MDGATLDGRTIQVNEHMSASLVAAAVAADTAAAAAADTAAAANAAVAAIAGGFGVIALAQAIALKQHRPFSPVGRVFYWLPFEFLGKRLHLAG